MNGDSKKFEDIIQSAYSVPDRGSRDEFLVQQSAGDEAMLNRLRELYTAVNRPDELQKWQTQRANDPESATEAKSAPEE